jgi:stage V sporulation protein S
MLETPEIAVDAPEDVTTDQPQPGSDQTVAQPSGVEILRVSTHSRPNAVAGAIAGVLRQRNSVEIQAIGAGATNQAVKAIAIAHSYLRDDGIDVGCVPFFTDVLIGGEERTALRLLVQRNQR